MGHCCEGGEIFYDTIQLPPCDCKFFDTQCAETHWQFDVEGRPIGPVTTLTNNIGFFPVQNFPDIVEDGCNGTSQSVRLRGVTRGYAGEAVGVSHGGFIGPDTLCKKDETCCLTFCHKMWRGIASLTATLEVGTKDFSGAYSFVGYYTYSNDMIWDETQIFFTPSSNIKQIIFRNVSSDPLDGPPSIFIDDVRIGYAVTTIDLTPPVIDCPPNWFVFGSGNPCIYDYEFPIITASDNHVLTSMSCTLDSSPATAGTIYSLGFGPHTVMCVAIDSCGNVDTCVYTINVNCHPTDLNCQCPAQETTFNLNSNGLNYTLACNQPLSTAPRLSCPPHDVNIAGSFACHSSQDTCENTVQFYLDRPGGLSVIAGSSTLGSTVVLTFPAAFISAPGLYTLTISTICPGLGSPDTCKCVMYWIQEECENLCACDSTGQAKPNLVINGHFSLGDFGFTSDLIGPSGGGCSCVPNSYCVNDEFRDKCSGWSSIFGDPGNFLIVDGFNSAVGNLDIWRQTVSVVTGNTYKLCFSSANVYGTNTPPFNLVIGIKDATTYYPLATETMLNPAYTWVDQTLTFTVPTGLIGPLSLYFAQDAVAPAGFSDFGLDNICLSEQKVEPLCKCGGFTGTKFCVLGSNPIQTECNLQNKIYNIPCPDTKDVNFCGYFKCNPDTCSPSTVMFALTNTNTGTVIHTTSLTLNASNYFTIDLLAGWCSDPSVVYEITTSGLCGNDTCICKVRFRVDCPQQSLCKCDQKFFSDVAQGFLQTTTGSPCIRGFSPIGLCPNDKVDWYRNGVYVTSALGQNSVTFPVFTGYGTVCMIVTRMDGPKICKDTFCSKTYCIAGGEIAAECGGIQNSSLNNDADDFLSEKVTMKNWMPTKGLVYASSDEGISGGNIMLIASKGNDAEVWFRWTPVVPKQQIKFVTMDVESFLSTPVPSGTTLDLYGVRANGDNVWLSSNDIGGYRKGWDGSIKGGIMEKTDEFKDFTIRLITSSDEQVFVRFDNVCFDFTTATSEESNQVDIDLYPNPTNGNFVLKTEIGNLSKSILKIHDTQGKLVYQSPLLNLTHQEINISHLPDAVYFVKILREDGKSTVKKVIKIH